MDTSPVSFVGLFAAMALAADTVVRQTAVTLVTLTQQAHPRPKTEY